MVGGGQSKQAPTGCCRQARRRLACRRQAEDYSSVHGKHVAAPAHLVQASNPLRLLATLTEVPAELHAAAVTPKP